MQTALALAPRVVAMAPALQVALMSSQRSLTTQAQENRRPALFRYAAVAQIGGGHTTA